MILSTVVNLTFVCCHNSGHSTSTLLLLLLFELCPYVYIRTAAVTVVHRECNCPHIEHHQWIKSIKSLWPVIARETAIISHLVQVQLETLTRTNSWTLTLAAIDHNSSKVIRSQQLIAIQPKTFPRSNWSQFNQSYSRIHSSALTVMLLW